MPHIYFFPCQCQTAISRLQFHLHSRCTKPLTPCNCVNSNVPIVPLRLATLPHNTAPRKPPKFPVARTEPWKWREAQRKSELETPQRSKRPVSCLPGTTKDSCCFHSTTSKKSDLAWFILTLLVWNHREGCTTCLNGTQPKMLAGEKFLCLSSLHWDHMKFPKSFFRFYLYIL